MSVKSVQTCEESTSGGAPGQWGQWECRHSQMFANHPRLPFNPFLNSACLSSLGGTHFCFFLSFLIYILRIKCLKPNRRKANITNSNILRFVLRYWSSFTGRGISHFSFLLMTFQNYFHLSLRSPGCPIELHLFHFQPLPPSASLPSVEFLLCSSCLCLILSHTDYLFPMNQEMESW